MNILIDGQTLESPEVNRGIGVYFKNVLNQMVKHSYEHIWYIAVSNVTALKALDPWVAQRLIPIIDPIYAPSSDYSRTNLYADALCELVDHLKIDAYWNPNPLMVNVLFPNKALGCRMFCMVHDVIPAILPVKEWSQDVHDEYRRRLAFLKEMPQLFALCNSKATETDLHQIVGTIPSRAILLAAEPKIYFQPIQSGKGDRTPYLVFTGGFDYRKNISGAVEAFACLKKSHSQETMIVQLKLYIVCNYHPDEKEQLEVTLNRLGIADSVILTGFISDSELRELYANCTVFFFPSLYEGFGLPIIEAMLSGAYILSSDNSCLPEVCGGFAMLCNAEDIKDMSEKLYDAVHASQFETAYEKQVRQNYALGLTWERTAVETLHTIETALLSEPVQRVKKRKIAFVTPWPKQGSGIANYNYQLLPFLAEYFEIDVFVDDQADSPTELLPFKQGKLYQLSELDYRHEEYEHIVYQLGNSEQYHKGIYEMFEKYPDVAEIHDYVLNPFFYHSYMLHGKKERFRAALEAGYGEEGLRHYQMIKSGNAYPDEVHFPMCHTAIHKASKTIFHNQWSLLAAKENGTCVIPLPSFTVDTTINEADIELMKQRIGYHAGETIIACFGYINANKRPEIVLEAVNNLNKKGKRVRLCFFGNCNVDDFFKQIEDQNMGNIVCITGYLEKTEYEAALALSDVIVNLRYPSMGESSGPLCEAFQHGKPVIVSEVNQYCEFPDEVCWKVPVGQNEILLLTKELEYLLEHPDVAQQIGHNAARYAKTVLSPVRIAGLYRELLEA